MLSLPKMENSIALVVAISTNKQMLPNYYQMQYDIKTYKNEIFLNHEI